MLYSTVYPHAELGDLTIASDGEAIVGLWIEGQKYFAGKVAGNLQRRDDLPVFAQVRAWLDRYFDGDPLPVATLHLKPGGTPFQQRVWKLLAASLTAGCAPTPSSPRRSHAIAVVRPRRAPLARRTGATHLHYPALPSRDRLGRQPDRIRRRHRPQGLAAGARGRRPDRPLRAEARHRLVGACEACTPRRSTGDAWKLSAIARYRPFFSAGANFGLA